MNHREKPIKYRRKEVRKMPDMTKNELNAVLELLKRRAEAGSTEQLIEDIEAMQSKLGSKAEITKAAGANPEK